MYYLSVVEITGKKSPIGTYYSAEEGLNAVDLQETVRYQLISKDSLDEFKKYVSKYIRERLFSSASSCTYEASIYQFDTLDEIIEILSKGPQGFYEVTWNNPNKIKITAPRVAFAQSTIPEEIEDFEIEWK